MLTFSRPNSQAKSRGVFFALLMRQGLDWCCRSISDYRGAMWGLSIALLLHHTHPQGQIQLRYVAVAGSNSHLPPRSGHTVLKGAVESAHPVRPY